MRRWAPYILILTIFILAALTRQSPSAIASDDAPLPLQAGATATPTPGYTPTSLPPGAYAGECKPWIQANDDAFDIPSNFDLYGTPIVPTPENAYQAEDVFEVTVFRNQLYLGMEADNKVGARLWRTQANTAIPSSQADWEEVAADSQGYPFGDGQRQENPPPGSGMYLLQNDHIDSLEEFFGYLYASTANGGGTAQGSRIYRSASGNAGSWEDAIAGYGPGFGDLNNTNFKDMIRFTVGGKAWLCGGTGNEVDGAQVWCTGDGEHWSQKSQAGFGRFEASLYTRVWSTEVYKGYLYAGSECLFKGEACPGAIFRTDGTPQGHGWKWTRVFTPDTDCTQEYYQCRVALLGDLNGFLYAGFADDGRGTQIFRSEDGAVWTPVVDDGFGNPSNHRLTTDAGTLYNGNLYLATTNERTGTEIWRTDGSDWERVRRDGLGSAGSGVLNNANLIPFNGYLVAWAENYTSGQKVYRTQCPVCQVLEIDGPGRYRFPAVGASLDISTEEVDRIEVCVYPDAFPEIDRSDALWTKRHYEINSYPSGDASTFTLGLSYTPEELKAASIHDESSLFLSRMIEGGWADCPAEQRSVDLQDHEAICSGASTFSTWAIAGLPGELKYMIFLPILLTGD